MAKYRKRDAEIEAMQFTGENGDEIAEWVATTHHVSSYHCDRRKDDNGNDHPMLYIEFEIGVMGVSTGNYVVKGEVERVVSCSKAGFES